MDKHVAPSTRCYGPRFTSFLQSVQQFAALSDVLIGGSQNIIACGVWSLVRMMLQLQLEGWANAIKEEVMLLMARRLEEEALENSQFRELSIHRVPDALAQSERQRKKLQLMKGCSVYDHDGSKVGTVVAYFFCQHDVAESLRARTVLGSLARQVIEAVQTLNDAPHWLSGAHGSLPDTDTVLSMLQLILLDYSRVVFIIDGLDECLSNEKLQLLQALSKLIETKPGLCVCLSLRVEEWNSLMKHAGTISLIGRARLTKPPSNTSDIRTYINSTLANRVESRRLVVGNAKFVLEIQEALLQGSQSMFHWAVLRIDSLCFERSDEAIRLALTRLPHDLTKAYSRILHRGSRKAGMTTRELGEALSVVVGDTVWNHERVINDVYDVLACCGSLVVVVDENSFPFTQRRMASIIVTYLNLDVLENQISTHVIPPKKQLPVQSMPSKIVQSTLKSNPDLKSSLKVQALALRLLRTSSGAVGTATTTEAAQNISNIIGGQTAAAARPPSPVGEEALQVPRHFRKYATNHWLSHEAWSTPTLLEEITPPEMEELDLQLGDCRHPDTSPFKLAVSNGDKLLVKLFLESKHYADKCMEQDGCRIPERCRAAETYDKRTLDTIAQFVPASWKKNLTFNLLGTAASTHTEPRPLVKALVDYGFICYKRAWESAADIEWPPSAWRYRSSIHLYQHECYTRNEIAPDLAKAQMMISGGKPLNA
ncbi:hypothetical protein B0H63DRAFT_524803 [Podospora didyma]|uniref:Nephrocystin 3-like N-terminal domain-containing protein n=1 Tax=Podospora didyma TaxID=330526 RepID=A0AAE0KJQ7_9PEZI|nr:hypothetical protein B0H63DRAFT_524803 [Podospora didyma]